MIDKVVYAKRLIKQWAAGRLSPEGQAELRQVQKLYSEDEWLRMEVEVLCELEDGRTGKEPVDWRPALRRAKRRERSLQLRKAISESAPWLGTAAALVMVLVLALRTAGNRFPSVDVGSNCPEWVGDGEIPGSEFACTVWWGDSTSITVAPSSRGRLAVIRNLEFWRHADGVLELVPTGRTWPADTAGTPAVRIATQPYQQCVVALPDGSRVRLNAGSVLEYGLWNLDRDTVFLRLQGQALVQHKENVKPGNGKIRLILETPDAQLQMASGAFTVVAERYRTRAVLLEGKAYLFSRWGDRQLELVYPGEAVAMKRCCTDPDGAITTEVTVSCVDAEDALAWTRMKREYRNAPVREFVADMSRWYGFRVEDMDCVPKGPRITATVCYQAPVGEVYAQLFAAKVFMTEKDGMVSFCGSETDPYTRMPGKGLLASADDTDECCGLSTGLVRHPLPEVEELRQLHFPFIRF